MNVLEMVMMVGFGVPIVVLFFAFVVCASYLQMKEDCRYRQGKTES